MSSSSHAATTGLASATATTTVLFCASVVGGIYLSKTFSHAGSTEPLSRDAAVETSTTAISDGAGVDTDIDNIANNENEDLTRILSPGSITIAYASTTGTCSKMAHSLHSKITSALSDTAIVPNIQIQPIHKFDWWDEFLNNENSTTATTTTTDDTSSLPPPILILLLPTWTNGTLPPPVSDNKSLEISFPDILESLKEIATDWRVPKKALAPSHLHLSVFGMGSSEYSPSTFCKPAKDVHRLLIGKLGAAKILPNTTTASDGDGKRNMNLTLGDDSVGNVEETVFQDWSSAIVQSVMGLHEKSSTPILPKEKASSCGCGKNDATSSSDDAACCQQSTHSNPQADSASDDDYPSSDEEEEDENEPEVIDMEDMGSAMNKSNDNNSSTELPEMVTKKQAAALKKEGYKLIGTHSAVKLCRWTKHQLRGRGGCYKHTFYGITSYQCMESTPSLACANKCVFCWRHHKNPVGTSWKWKTDDPYEIVSESIATHVKMIKETKGIPGVLPERWKEAHTVKHCALSLVGEPIMYPRIDEFLGELHRRKISTFLVTNGQHPDAIASLRPVTQLYVSVDAPTPESLDAIDRPLFTDAWDRLKRSLTSLKERDQRTVARLTVVKGWNSDEIGGYADLIALGQCSIVEIKGVTFCGKSDASNLNMTNTPWHHEVVELAKALCRELATLTAKGGPNAPPLYGLACEHKHSCSVLLARKDQFLYHETDPVTQQQRSIWKTWIDYDKFEILIEKHRLDPTFTFGVKDYVAETPAWALSGAAEEGFDPTDTRHFRKKKLYTQFDDRGVPTHDKDGLVIGEEERKRLERMMEEKQSSDGDNVVVKMGKGGEKEVMDVSLMFRGMVVDKK